MTIGNESIFVPHGTELALHFNDFRVTEDFSLKEFQCPCCHAVVLSRRLTALLQLLRDRLGEPLVVASGYRCSTMNEAVGADAASLHRCGLAVDIAVCACRQEDFCKKALQTGFSKARPNSMRGYVHLEAWPEKTGVVIYA
ncbi:MAG: D-Ala-D-Ala carboxypeptidase family metallohydrolase [Synergistes sp.]|nr:D-Ala-D-Ala carboxypeptidase family metallohydrolase [Synergistes sp.]